MQPGSADPVYRLKLALSLEDNELTAALSGLGERLEIRGELPLDPEGYWLALDWVAQGNPPPTVLQDMAGAIVKAAIPTETAERLRSFGGTLKQHLLAIQVQINNPLLEKFPWELLGQPGAITPSIDNIVVWRRVSARKSCADSDRSSNTILLVGSTPLDLTSPHTYPEVQAINDCIQTPWISLAAHPSTTIDDFNKKLQETRPAAVHVIAHASDSVLSFQATPHPGESADRESGHHSLHYQELAKQLEYSPTAILAVLSACHSAKVRKSGRLPISLEIAEAGLATVGSAAFLPPRVGVTFSKGFYRSIASGKSIIEAYYAGVVAVRQDLPEPFSLLWSIQVLYSPEGCQNVIVFPTDQRGRARRELGQLQELAFDLNELEWEQGWSPSEWAEKTAALCARLAYTQDSISALREVSFAQSETYESYFLGTVAEMDEHLEAITDFLSQVRSSSFRTEEDQSAGISAFERRRAGLRWTLRKIERNLNRMR